MIKNIFLVLLLLLTLIFLTSCYEGDASPAASQYENIGEQTNMDEINTGNQNEANEAPATQDLPNLDGTLLERVIDNPVEFLQLSPLTPGEELVVFHTTMGDITVRMFPDDAPRAVENFLTHARNGFYNGVIFHRVIPEFMAQTGDPTGTGRGGESIWGQPFGVERSFNLRHFRGALAMAHAGGAMNSQFYFVQSTSIDPRSRAQFEALRAELDTPIGSFSDGRIIYGRDIHSVEEFDEFLQNGGTPFLDWMWNDNPHTVFGHVVEGMDVVDAIVAVDRDGNDRPNEDIIIERISFVIYG